MRNLAVCLAMLGLPAAAAAEQPKTGADLSPDLMIVADFSSAKGQVHLKLTQMREQDVQELAIGKGVQLKTEKVVGPFRQERFLDLKKCRVREASGKAIPPAEFPKRFQAGAVVVVTTDGNPPSRAFLRILRPDTVIVVGPAVKADPRIKLPPEPPPMPK